MCRRGLSNLFAACAGLLVAVLTSGCIPALPHGRARAPHTEVPANYGGWADSTNSAQTKWSEFFTDPKLNALIETALKNNQELNIVSLEVDIVQYEIMARRGEYLPKVGFGLGAGIEKVGAHTSQGVADEVNGVPQHLPNFAIGFSASWEIDVWSKLRNATKAATLRYLASKEGRNFAVTRLVGEIASSYYELVALDALLDVLKQNIEIQQNALMVVKLQKEAAKVTELAVKRFEAEVLKNQSRQYALEQRRILAENRINFLGARGLHGGAAHAARRARRRNGAHRDQEGAADRDGRRVPGAGRRLEVEQEVAPSFGRGAPPSRCSARVGALRRLAAARAQP